MISDQLELTHAEFDGLIAAAAEKGASAALKRVGLADEYAGQDVRELRNLLDTWRAAKRTVFKTTVSMVARAVLWLFLLALAFAAGKSGGLHLNITDI